MRTIPLSIGTLHFVGIGGIGMSGIAEILHNLGYTVQGSDIAENPNVKRLKTQGITVFIGHDAAHVDDAAIIVVSTAISPDNPELLAARQRMIPVVHRAEMLGELMRLKWSIAVAGTHGKTTTTSLIAAVLDSAGLDPTIINGGIINAYGTNARLGDSEWMVVESDESDGSFVKLPATIAVVTNIDPEHLDFHGTFEKLQDAFESFVQNIPFYGFAAMCLDHPTVQALIPRVADRRIVTYGFGPQADVRGVDVEITPAGSRFTAVITDRTSGEERRIETVLLPMYGRHNVQNALAAIAVAAEMGLPDSVVRQGLEAFAGVKRRFTKTGKAGGITVIDDYGHHPVEISAVLSAARAACGGGKVIAVVQPHRYTRLRDLFEDFCHCFNDADAVIVAEVYPAGEAPIPGIHRDALVNGLIARGHRHVVALGDPVELAATVVDLAKPGDMVVCMGAGNITAWAQALPDQLRHILGDGPAEAAPAETTPAETAPATSRAPVPFPIRRPPGGGGAA
ncbi:MAG: UDP-N-acetylmuramate--L-alanine ligase [Alphaproteobacteria bacterium]|nr:UDP-N-acetylmuramate--L-alanine ligase [Alphaproteobacteria bacterium]